MMATAIRLAEGAGHRHPRSWSSTGRSSCRGRRSRSAFGGVPASPYNALRAARAGPPRDGVPRRRKGAAKPFNERYRLERFGRGGFIELALRAGAPIVPCAVVGSEEIYPKLGEAPCVARVDRSAVLPDHTDVSPAGTARRGAAAVAVADRVRRADRCSVRARRGRRPGAGLAFAEEVRERIQSKVYENLVEREGAFLVMADPQFRSAQEFREVMDRMFALMSEDPDMGPEAPRRRRRRSASSSTTSTSSSTSAPRAPARRRTSLGVDATTSTGSRRCDDDVVGDGQPYFQGKENIAMAIARRRIKTGGDVKAALALIPITKPVYERYRELRGARVPAPRRSDDRRRCPASARR